MAGVYVHIPFCAKKCYYCDFYSGPLKANHGEYVDCLIAEIEAKTSLLPDGVSTVYVGGGTPSVLERRELRRLLGCLKEFGAEEFTVEVNPEDVDKELVDIFKGYGVNRVSMGVQSFVDEELRSVGRRHDSIQAIGAVKLLRDGGLPNISVDLIYGLPGQSVDSWRYSLDTALRLLPEHLSCYMLSYEPGTLLHTRLDTGKIAETDEATLEAMFGILCERTAAEGYEHYEISNFAREGFRSRHNSSYWKFVPYLGIGAGAHSFVGGERYSNPANIRVYMAGSVTAWEKEQGDEDSCLTDKMNEFLMVGLRTSDGVDMEDFAGRFGDEAAALVREKALAQSGEGNVVFTRRGFRIPEERWLVSNSIIVEFFW